MRPTRLRIQGFSAFREPVEVDFTEVELGALVGPTGSGKSSVIDAVTFALFGQVARYDNAKMVAPAIHQNANEARILLEFRLGDTDYRAARVVRRNAGGREGATTKEARLERIDDGSPVVLAGRASEMEAAVTELLGLDFARFTKTVVLPQGRFAAFLHDTPGSRLDLLRELLDIKVYDRMATMARRSADTASNQADILRQQLTGRPNDEQVAAQQAKVEKISAAVQQYGELMAHLGEREQVADEATAAVEAVSGDLAALQSVVMPDDIGQLAERLEKAAAAVAESTQQVDEAERRLQDASAAAAEGPEQNTIEQALERLRRRADIDAEVQVLVDRHDKGTVLTREAIAAANEVRDELERLDAATQAARQAVDAARRERDELGSVEQLQTVKRRRFERSEAAEAHDTAELAAKEAVAVAGECRSEAERAAKVEAEAQARRQTLATLRGASALVSELVIGEACPVCRQQVVSLPDHDLDAEWAQVEQESNEATTAATRCRTALAAADSAAAAADATLAEVRRRLAQLDAELEHAPDEAAIAAALSRIDDATERVAVAEREAEAAGNAAATRRSSTEVAEVLDAERKATATLAGIEAKLDTRRADLAELVRATAELPDVLILEQQKAEAVRLRQAVVDAQSALDEARRVAASATAAEAELAEARDAAGERFEQVRDSVARLSPPRAEGSILQRWQVIAGWADAQRSTLTNSLTASRAAKESADSLVAETARAIDEVCRPVVAGASPPADARGWSPLLATAEAEARAGLTNLERDRARLDALARQADDLAASAEVDRELAKLLGARGFEQWLTEEVLEILVERATERLTELSNGQYSLVSVPGGDIRVRDHRNADEVRDAKTLSGGETFLASLALALALSDASAELAADGGPMIEALFLDEGFGTLDGDTLDTVAAALEELGAAGRMVIIVTHIRELADRMPVRFEVSKGPTSSTVERREL